MVELGFAVQIKNIGEVFFHQPLLLRLEVARLMTPTGTDPFRLAASMTEMKYAAFSSNWQPGVPKYNWVNWQWAGYTNQNRDRLSDTERTFSEENN